MNLFTTRLNYRWGGAFHERWATISIADATMACSPRSTGRWSDRRATRPDGMCIRQGV